MSNLKHIPRTIITLAVSANTTFCVNRGVCVVTEVNENFCTVVCDESPGVVSYILTICSLLLVLVTLPFSLLYTVKVVQVRSGARKNKQTPHH